MKKQRILEIYLKLLLNKEINIEKLAIEFDVCGRSISRDIKDLRDFFKSAGEKNEIIYNSRSNAYTLQSNDEERLSNDEILAVCKILLDSRAFVKDEMISIIDKILGQCTPMRDYKKVEKLIENEKFHYIEPRHKSKYLDKLWKLGDAIQNQTKIEISYSTTNKKIVKRKLHPVGMMFSEYYFYLLAYIENANREHFANADDKFPTIYRIDRIKWLEVLNENFPVYHKDRFEEGMFRKRVQFMTGGRLRKLRFKYFGGSLEAVLDRLPTAVVKGEQDGCFLIEAEVFGDGVDRWILSQGKEVEVLD
jgi:predicted DNA-binding transcriptional regulator YafY